LEDQASALRCGILNRAQTNRMFALPTATPAVGFFV
jgi:hypothetical protein